MDGIQSGDGSPGCRNPWTGPSPGLRTWRAGLVAAAAGNECKRQVDPDFEIGVLFPAAADGVTSTGALGRSGTGLTVAPCSNTFPQISAPGVGVISAKPGGHRHGCLLVGSLPGCRAEERHGGACAWCPRPIPG
jgi:hypothetical protein